MINNVIFEIKKILKNKIFIYSIIVLFLINGIVTFYYNKNYNNKTSNNEISIIDINESEYKNYKYYSNYKEYKKQYNKYMDYTNVEKVIENYKLRKNIKLNAKEKNVFEQNKIILLLIMLPVSIIGSTSYSNEINNGTMKAILTKPKSRLKIFLSKIISVNLVCIILILLNFSFSTFFTLIFTKSNLFSLVSLVYVNNEVIEINYYLKYLSEYLINSIPVLFIGNLSLILSIASVSTAFSVGASIFLSLISSTIAEFLLLFKFRFIQYTFLPYLDFTIFKDYVNILQFNISYGVNLCLKNGILILIITVLISYFLLYFYFNKKDIG